MPYILLVARGREKENNMHAPMRFTEENSEFQTK